MEKSLTRRDGAVLLFGSIVGSGIFASPGSVFVHSQESGQLALLIWALAGFIAYCGALCYLELAMKLPSAAGESHYLDVYFGKTVGFLFTWTTAIVARPSSFAITSIVCGRYFCRFIHGAGEGGYCEQGNSAETFYLAIGVALIVMLCTVSTRLTNIVLRLATFASMFSLTAAIAIGLYFAATQKQTLHARVTALPALGEIKLTQVSTALLSALWSFDGWNTLNYASEEFENASTDLPIIVRACMVLITLIFVFVNFAYLVVLDANVVARSESIGVDLAQQVFGWWGAALMPLFVALSAFGASVGILFAGSRLVFATAAEEGGTLPMVLGNLTPMPHRVPFNAILCQFALGLAFIFVGDFEALVGMFSCATWVFYLLAVLGLIRSKLHAQPVELSGGYEAPVYALVLFPATCFFLILFQVLAQPGNSLSAFAFILLGVPFYLLQQRFPFCARYVCCLRRKANASPPPVKADYQTF